MGIWQLLVGVKALHPDETPRHLYCRYKPAAAFFRRCALADDSAEQINAREAHRSLGFCINVMRADAGDDAPPPITLRKRKSGRGTPKAR